TARSLLLYRRARRLRVLTARGLRVLTARSLGVLAARSLLRSRARGLRVLTARGLRVLAARGLRVLTARGLRVLTARGLRVLAARGLVHLTRTGERPRSLRVLAPGHGALLREQLLGLGHLGRAGGLSLADRREGSHHGHAHEGCKESLHHLPVLLSVSFGSGSGSPHGRHPGTRDPSRARGVPA